MEGKKEATYVSVPHPASPALWDTHESWVMMCLFILFSIFQRSCEGFFMAAIFLLTRTPEVLSRNYWVSAIKNQMAKRTLNFRAGNGNWWRPCNHKRKLFIGPEHTLHWIHRRISCSFVGKYSWKRWKVVQFGLLFWYCTLEGTSGVLGDLVKANSRVCQLSSVQWPRQRWVFGDTAHIFNRSQSDEVGRLMANAIKNSIFIFCALPQYHGSWL